MLSSKHSQTTSLCLFWLLGSASCSTVIPQPFAEDALTTHNRTLTIQGENGSGGRNISTNLSPTVPTPLTNVHHHYMAVASTRVALKLSVHDEYNTALEASDVTTLVDNIIAYVDEQVSVRHDPAIPLQPRTLDYRDTSITWCRRPDVESWLYPYSLFRKILLAVLSWMNQKDTYRKMIVEVWDYRHGSFEHGLKLGWVRVDKLGTRGVGDGEVGVAKRKRRWK